MEGVIELAEEIFHMPVRLGFPQNVKGLADIVANPIYSTGVGLLQYSLRHQPRGHTSTVQFDNKESFFAKIKSMFQGGA